MSEDALNEDWLRPDWPASHVTAFMTTRAGGVSRAPHESMNIGRSVGDDIEAVMENRARVSRAVGATAIFLPQVHGNAVLRLQSEHAQAGADLPKVDAAVSTDPELAVAIQVADCLPVLFAAPGGVAGAHAGWRGLAAGVLENTVSALCEAASCRPDQIHAWLGACIGPAAFEVGADVLQAFGREPPHKDVEHFRFQPNAAGEPRWRADLAALAKERLAPLGLASTSGGHWCTVSGPQRFFSYRGEARGGARGRMVAAIALNGALRRGG